MTLESKHQVHTFEPVFDENSRVLILGTFPSVKSRENGFYYGHPQNRFWPMLTELFGGKILITNEEKKELLLSCGIALWDVLGECEIAGSSDATIKNGLPNDLKRILRVANVEKILLNGTMAWKLYQKHFAGVIDTPAFLLPSTSPANAAKRMEDLKREWGTALDFLICGREHFA